MFCLWLYLSIGSLFAINGLLKDYEDYNMASAIIFILLWPLIVIVAMLPGDSNKPPDNPPRGSGGNT